MLGMLALGATVFLCESSNSVSQFVHGIGKLWIPGAEGIGSYSGKETVALTAWLSSWFLFHLLFRRKELKEIFWLTLFLLGVGIATTLVWPPTWKLFLGH